MSFLPFRSIPVGGGGGSANFPFDSQPVTSGTQISFYPGTIGNILPSNMLVNLDFDPDKTQYLNANCVADDKHVISLTLAIENDAPPVPTVTENIPPPNFKIGIGMLVSGNFFNYWKKSINATPVEVLRVPKETVDSPFEIPYTSWYNWNIF